MRNKIALLMFWVICFLSVSPSRVSAQPIAFRKTTPAVLESRLHDCPERSAQRLKKLRELFRAAGCAEDRLSEQPVKGSPEPNLVCTLRGELESTILIGAHFDNEGSGHGVIDNWTGAVLLPILYESLKAYPRKHTFVFIEFAAEEAGLLGSKCYADHMASEEVTMTRAIVNLDCLGLGSTAVWVSHSEKALVDTLDRLAAAAKLPLRGVNVGKVGFMDAESFSRYKIPKILLHSITQRTLQDINSFNDNFDVVRWQDYYDSYLLVAAYLAYLDSSLK
jgi:hypothetical protein